MHSLLPRRSWITVRNILILFCLATFFAFLFFSERYETVAQSSGLVAHYTFDAGNANDSSGNGNNGSLVGGATFAPGQGGGQALSLNGTSAYVSIPDASSISLTGDISFALWVNPQNVSSYRTVLCKQAQSTHVSPYCNYGMWRGSGVDAWRTRIEAVDQVSWGSAQYGSWTHLACTFNNAANTVRCYQNGTLTFTSASYTSNPSDSPYPLRIGSTAAGEYFAGLIDDVRIYGRVLSDAEVAALAVPPPPPDTTNPNVSLSAPSSGSTVSGSISVTATASDNVGVVGVQFLLDGVNLGSEDTTAPYSVSWDTTTASNGPHTLTARARDAAGNTATSAGVSVTVSNGGGGLPADPTPGGLFGHYGEGRGWGFHHTNSAVETINFPNLGAVFVCQTGIVGNCGNGRADDVAVSWGGYVRIDTAGSHRFRIDVASASQSSGIWIAGSTLWDDVGDRVANITLSAGWHQISVWTDADPGQTNTQAQLYWTPPGGSEMILPASNLSPEEGVVQTVSVPDISKPKAKFNYRVTGIKFDEFPLRFDRPFVSFAAWVKTSDADGYIIHGDGASGSDPDEVGLRISGGFPEFVLIRGGGALSTVARSSVRVDQDGRWHHVVGIREDNNGRVSIYVDGVLRGTGGPVSGWALVDNPDQVEIGSRGGTGDFLSGIIDDVRIYNRPLRPSEVSSWFAGNNPPAVGTVPTIGLVGHWPLNEGNSNTAADTTRHHNNATLMNGLASGWTTGAFGSALNFNGSNQFMSITDTGITDNIIELNLNAIVPPGESVMVDEVLVFWSEGGVGDPTPGLTVRNLTTGVQANVSGTPIVTLSGIVEGAWAKLPSSVISTSGTLRLAFFDDESPPRLGEGLVFFLPYTESTKPQEGRVTLYLSAGHADSGVTPVAVVPVEGVAALEPFFAFFDGETGYTAPGHYRPNYVIYKTGTDLATAPSRFSALRAQGASLLFPSAAGSPRPFENANPDTWYPLFGRNGLNFDILSSRYVANSWNGEQLLGNNTINQIQLPVGTTWVAFQGASSNLASDDPVGGGPESVGFFAGVGAFSTLDFGEEPGAFDFSLSNSGAINIEPGASGQSTIFVAHEDGTPAPVSFSQANVTGLPTGASATFSGSGQCTPPDGSSCQLTMTVTTPPSTPIGNYPLTVRGVSGGQSRTTNIALSVNNPPPPAVLIDADPDRILEGGASTITWNASDADACTVTGPSGVIQAGSCTLNPLACIGSHNTGPLFADSEFRISCNSGGGTTEGTVNVSVKVVVIRER